MSVSRHPTFAALLAGSFGLLTTPSAQADQATLDATPDGLLADRRTIAALLLDELTRGTAA